MGGVFRRWSRVGGGVAGVLLALLAGCDNSPWESGAASQNTLFSAMQEGSPRHMDSVASYWSNDTTFTYQIFEPPYGYHYLKRPYTLIGKAAEDVAKPRYLDKDGNVLPEDAPSDQVAESVYDVHIKRGILYQPHPAFAKDGAGNFLYHHLKPGELGLRSSPLQFAEQGTRELVADDFVYALKRQATTRITTPIFGIWSEYVVGLKDYGDTIKARGREAARRASTREPRPPVPRLPPLAAGRRDRARQAPAAHPHQGQVPAVELLDGDDLHGAGALGGGRVLRPARLCRRGPHVRHLAGGHRPVHAHRVPPGPPAGDAAQSELPW